ncbi:MAG: 4Fe-4S dicluster domain-containing protein [Cyclobacteriaceae bacterium]|nr:4Fe-4S dicluster domain-containing protein [Cyclobacteriaceae bacterium HetDA_MAG_MS6]
MSTYARNIGQAIKTLSEGLKLTFKYLLQARKSREPIGVEDPNYFKKEEGTVTLQYPYEAIPVPDTGRYRLHNEIDDCIVCDKCAKVCPVDCIDIEPIKSAEEIGKTSDGTPKRLYAAKFDIDMAKCCFCGLCTTVCPTECLTMTKVYDFSEYDVRDHNYVFAEMTPLEILTKQKAYEEHQAKKEAEKAKTSSVSKPVTRPEAKVTETTAPSEATPVKPKFRPKPMTKKPTVSDEQQKTGEGAEKPVKAEETESTSPAKPKPKFRPKPTIKQASTSDEKKESNEIPKPKPVFKPKPMIKRKPKDE